MSERKRYVATINVPGYSPMADEPAVFDTAHEAWSWLAGEREHDEDHASDGDTGYSDTHTSLVQLGDAIESQPGSVWGDTPGYDGNHDLGLAYSVQELAHATYPHEPGRLHDCAACEAYCWCVDSSHMELCVHCGGVDTGERSCDGEACGSTSH